MVSNSYHDSPILIPQRLIRPSHSAASISPGSRFVPSNFATSASNDACFNVASFLSFNIPIMNQMYI